MILLNKQKPFGIYFYILTGITYLSIFLFANLKLTSFICRTYALQTVGVKPIWDASTYILSTELDKFPDLVPKIVSSILRIINLERCVLPVLTIRSLSIRVLIYWSLRVNPMFLQTWRARRSYILATRHSHAVRT